MYEEQEFHYINPIDIEEKYLPYYEECFKVVINGEKVTSQITDKIYNVSKFNTYVYIKDLIAKEKINHIYEYVNMFFMFKEQYDIIEHRYLRRDRFGNVMESPVQLADRVATFIALSEPQDRITSFDKMSKWYPVFLKKMLNMELVPNTPAMVSAGIPGFGSFACVVVDNDDNLEDISKWYKDTTFLNRSGFGIGHSLHKLRPGGSPYGKSKIRTKSSINWLFPIDDLSQLMSQGTSGRAGANMVSIPVWHPDVVDFISFKASVPLANSGKENARKLMKQIMNSDLNVKDKEKMVDMIDKSIPLKSFNMSILVNDKFMEAVKNDEDWVLNFGLPDHEQKIEITKKARDIFNLICKNAHETGDPGLLFYDRINADNVVKKVKNGIFTTNPSLPYDVRIATDNGLVPIGKLAEVGHANVFNKYGQMVKSLVFQDGWDEDIVLVKFKNGQEIEMTPSHELVDTYHKKIQAKNLKSGDMILTDYSPLYNMREQIDGNRMDNGFLFGCFTGDGHATKTSDDKFQYGLCLGEEEYESFGPKVLGIIHRINGIDNVNFSDKETYHELSSSKKELREFFDLLGYSKEHIPNSVFTGSLSFVKGFIDGLFSTDGAVSKEGNSMLLVNKSKKFLQDIQTLLSYYGIKSNIHGGKTKKPLFPNGKDYDRDYYRYCLNVNGKNLLKFTNIFSLSHNRKQQRIIDHIKNYKKNAKHHNSRHLIVDSVVALEDKKDVYTLKMLDRTNEFNLHGIVSGNCGEIPLHPFSVCNLWTINLLKHFDFYHRKLTIGKLRDTINVAVRAGDNLTTVNHYPKEVPEIEKAAKEERRIGIDYTGLADYLYLSKITYGSGEAIDEINMLYKFLRDTARNYSVRLAKKKGSFPLWRKSSYYISKDDFANFKEKKCPKCAAKVEKYDDYIQCSKCNWAKFLHLRNMHLLTQAPTGTRSRMLSVSWGIEPHFYKWWESNVMEGKSVPGINRILEWYIKSEYKRPGYANFSSLCKQIDDNILEPLCLEHWIEAHDLKPEQHLRVQSIVQKWVDQAVSKTINLPKEATVDDISHMYMLAWESGLKGITMYRDGSHFKEVIGKKEKCPECESENLLKVEGCLNCRDCGWAKCSI